MMDFLFAPPWWLPVTIVIVGVALFVSGNARQKVAVRNSGAGVILAAILLMIVAHFVETDKEKVTRQTREIVHAVDVGDWPKMSSLLDPHASMAIPTNTIYSNRKALVQGAQHSTEHYALKSVVITSLDVNRTDTIIIADLDVLTVQEATMGRPVPSSWQLEWQQMGDGWTLYRITCLKVGDHLTDLRGMFVK